MKLMDLLIKFNNRIYFVSIFFFLSFQTFETNEKKTSDFAKMKKKTDI